MHDPDISTKDAGPFSSNAELVAWFNHKYDVAKRMNPVIKCFGGLKDCGPFPEDFPLVFTHLDLVPRNIMLGDDGRIWLIDFGLSGFYPEWFEYVAMFEWERLGWLGKVARQIVAGFYGKQARFMDYIWWALNVGYIM